MHDELEKTDEALADLSRAIELAPEDPEAYINRRLVYKKTGDVPQAIEELETVLELRPNASWSSQIEILLEQLKAQQ
jgi:regulator of sirC expression with transglutaminase-like and TPR domain